MKLTFDYYHNLEQVELRLCNPDGRELFILPGKNRNLKLRFNDLSELVFDVDSTITLSDGNVVNLEAYDYIQTRRLVYATNIGWFQISNADEHDNGVVKYKSVTAESYQSVLKNKGFISEERVYCFYNPSDPYDNNYDSLNDGSMPSVLGQWGKQLGIKQDLTQGLKDPDVPYDDWTVTYIHSSLIYGGEESKCRTFKETTTYGYDWIINDVEEAFEIVVLFDFMYKTIRVMIPSEVAERANVIYSFSNFMKNIDINENDDDIVTVLNCNGDNCDITAVNPTGTNYICDFSYYMDKVNHRWMSPALIAKLETWKADCDAEKERYEGYIEDLRGLYQGATAKETLLQEMSLSLADLRTAQNKRTVLGSGTPGSLCGIVTAETVKSYRTTINGVETVVGGRSIKPGTAYHSTDFTGATTITAYQYAPKYNVQTKQWDWSSAGATKTGTADEIVAYNLSDTNTTGVSYWYFSDVSDGSSYCKLQSAVTVNKDTPESIHYCGGFDRYIAYTYPIVSEGTGKVTYTDTIQSWINLREQKVKELNIDLYGYGFTLSGYQRDYKKTVDTSDGLVYVTTGADGKLLPTNESIYGQINSKNVLVSEIANRLNILSYFASTPALLRELNCYWIEGDYTNEHISVLEETTPEETVALSNELLAAGRTELNKVCQPRFSFSIESRDATKQYEFKEQMESLELGKVITIEKEEGVWYYPALLEISMSLDDSEEFNLTFANAIRLDDWGYEYADLISSSASTSRQVSANWQDIVAYAKERETISSIIKDPLDTSLRAAFANMVNQEFITDKNGILGRKRVSETSDEFENEQVRLINNLLIFTDDNWETAKTALGKIYYKDEDGNLVTSYGLVAETIIGSLMIGEKLKIHNNGNTVNIDGDGISIKTTVTDDEGNEAEVVVFQAAPDGTLVVRNYATADSVASAIDLAENGIKAYAKSTGGTAKTFSWSLTSSGFVLKSNNTTVMNVTSSGMTVKGHIEATSGDIGGCEIIDGVLQIGKANADDLEFKRGSFGSWNLGQTIIWTSASNNFTDCALYSDEIVGKNSLDRIRTYQVFLTPYGVYVCGREDDGYVVDAGYYSYASWHDICERVCAIPTMQAQIQELKAQMQTIQGS